MSSDDRYVSRNIKNMQIITTKTSAPVYHDGQTLWQTNVGHWRHPL